MSFLAIVILVLACVFLLKLMKRKFARAAFVGIVLLGFLTFAFVSTAPVRRSAPRQMTVAMSINNGRHFITLDGLDYLRKKGVTEAEIDRFLRRQLHRNGKVEIVRYQDPMSPIVLGREKLQSESGTEVSVAISKAGEELSRDIVDLVELKADVADLESSITELAAVQKNVNAELSSDAEYAAEEDYSSKEVSQAIGEAYAADVAVSQEADRETSSDETEEEVTESLAKDPKNTEIAAGYSNVAPEWTIELNEWDGKTFRTEVLLTTESDEGIDEKLLDEGFDLALANFTKWYREQEGLSSVWYDKFPYEIRRRSDKKRCYQDKYLEAKVFPTAGDNEVVIVTHGLYEFGDSQQRRIRAHYDSVHSLAKTGTAGVGFAGLLGVLATCFGYLKMCDGSPGRKSRVMKLVALGGLVGVATLVLIMAQALPHA